MAARSESISLYCHGKLDVRLYVHNLQYGLNIFVWHSPVLASCLNCVFHSLPITNYRLHDTMISTIAETQCPSNFLVTLTIKNLKVHCHSVRKAIIV